MHIFMIFHKFCLFVFFLERVTRISNNKIIMEDPLRFQSIFLETCFNIRFQISCPQRCIIREWVVVGDDPTAFVLQQAMTGCEPNNKHGYCVSWKRLKEVRACTRNDVVDSVMTLSVLKYYIIIVIFYGNRKKLFGFFFTILGQQKVEKNYILF